MESDQQSSRKKVYAGILTVISSFVVIIVSLSAAGLAEVSNIKTHPVDYILRVEKWNATRRKFSRVYPAAIENISLCEQLKQFELLHSDTIVSVCLYQNRSRVHIGHLAKYNAGVWLYSSEWRELTKFMYAISKALVGQK